MRIRFVGAHHVHIDIAAGRDKPPQEAGAADAIEKPESTRFPDDDLSDIVLARHAQQRHHDIGVGRGYHFRAQLPRHRKIPG